MIVHMISQTFNFCRDVFWSFSSFYSIVFVRSLWLWLSRGGTQSCGRPPLQRMVALCMCIIYVITTYSSFSSPSFYFCYILLTPFYWYTIPWVISIYLLHKCARSWSSVELLGKVASLTTTTSIIPLAVRVIGIELLIFLMITLFQVC